MQECISNVCIGDPHKFGHPWAGAQLFPDPLPIRGLCEKETQIMLSTFTKMFVVQRVQALSCFILVQCVDIIIILES